MAALIIKTEITDPLRSCCFSMIKQEVWSATMAGKCFKKVFNYSCC